MRGKKRHVGLREYTFNVNIPLIKWEGINTSYAGFGGDDVLREKVAIRRQLLPLMEMLLFIDRKDEEGIKKCASKIKSSREGCGATK